MSTRTPSIQRQTPLQRLARSLSVAFALASPTATAGTIFVTNCLDNGAADDLRHSIAAAHDFDKIDLSACANSTISLHNGEIPIPQDNLTILGPGKDSLSIDGKYNNVTQHARIFNHPGSGLLWIQNLTIGGGYLVTSGNAFGGCISSQGPVDLFNVDVAGCQARAGNSGAARGGAIYAANGAVYVDHGLIAGNYARGGTGAGTATGGAIAAFGVHLSRATVSGNRAAVAPGSTGSAIAGGVFSSGSSSAFFYSTISGNSADTIAGGAWLFSPAVSIIANSTISGNKVTAGVIGGLEVRALLGGTLTIYNSTIAFNTASGTAYAGHVYGPGLVLAGVGQGMLSVTMQSTLIANNTYGTPATERDLTTYGNVAITGSTSLIVRAPGVAIPQDTLHDICPLLGPLRNNGGPTATHALMSSSPAIDHGNNIAQFSYDQRDPPYARVDNGAADIGAYEVQHAEIVFDAGFDGCPI